MAVADTLDSDAPAAAARSSSFYAAMRILPRAKRDAMYDVYAFCRAVDDIVDDTSGQRADKLARLEQWREIVDALAQGFAVPGHARLGETIRSYGLAREDFLAVIDGMAMDAEGDIRAPDVATLDLYCDRVASAVGRLSTPIFGMPHAAGVELAHHLGRALQLTNILRDIDEDAAIGRLYLPAEALRAAGIASTEPADVILDPALPQACAPLVAQALDHYEAAQRVMAQCERSVVRAPRIMGAVYRRLLEASVERGFAAPRERIRLGRVPMIAIALKHLIF